MKKTLLILTTVIGSMTFAQDCSDLFISEYVEGWSNNKALEIYNPTSASIDLSQYVVIRYSNGSSTATAANAIQLIGMVASYDVHVATLDKTDPNGTGQNAPIWDSLQIRTDEFYCPSYPTSNAFYWNGDDAVVLAKGLANDPLSWVLVDVFGKIGEDPGSSWTTGIDPNGQNYITAAGGDDLTKDHSLIRKPSVLKGVVNPIIVEFNALAEYDSIPPVYKVITATDTLTYGNWNTLGWHYCHCNVAGVSEVSLSNVSIFPNPSNGDFYIKGINDFTTISVVNSLGQNVKTINDNTKSIVKLSMDAYKGVYFVKLTAKNGEVITKRIIVK